MQIGIFLARCTRFLFGDGCCRRGALMLVAGGLLMPGQNTRGGTWTALANFAPGGIGTMVLLTDGTVMAQNGSGTAWCRLTQDIYGSYVNGTWSTLTPMNYTRLYYSSDVLRDGRVFIAGAEYGTGTNSAEVYDPVGNTWTPAPPPPAGQTLFYDSVSKILPNGNVLVSPVGPATYGGTVIYNSTSNTWSVGPKLFRGGNQDEASWVKLPDDSILTVDPFGTSSERYIPALNKWVNDGVLPVAVYDPFLSEEGAAFLLPDGRAFYLGSTGHTVFYTPTGTTNAGAWTAGPDIPNAQGTPDAPAAMMVNGVILCAVSPAPTNSNYTSPTSFYEFDPVANAFTQVNGPTGLTLSGPSYDTRMLDLPDGTVLFTDYGSQLYVYQPSGSPLAAGKPAITGITTNADGSYHLTGTLLNGISEGAAYGDDAQMNSNYPLIRMTNSTGNVYYARTFNWSSTGVMTGSTPESTDFNVPAGLPVGTYSLVVVANGISSDPVPFVNMTGPPPQLVQNGGFEAGSFIYWTQSGNIASTYSTSSSSYVHSGAYGAELGPTGSPGYLSQTLATSPGQSYLLSCWLDNPVGGTPNLFLVNWGANTVYSQTNLPALGWTNLQFIVTATTSSTVLQFGFQDDPDYLGLDDVSVVPIPPTVFQSLTKSNNTVRFNWTAKSGMAYQVQYKTNLFQASWNNLGIPIPAAGSSVTVTDTPGADPQRFYRLIVLP